MPINELVISSGVAGLIDGEYFDDEMMEDIVLQLDPDVRYTDLAREDIEEIALEGANILFSYLIGAMTNMQRTLREVEDLVEVIERYEAEDQDWEL